MPSISSKVEILEKPGYGNGLYAKKPIKKDEFIGSFKGKIYRAERATLLPPEAINHAMQISEKEYSLPKDPTITMANHSCDPNSGIRGIFDIVAMRDINAGEEITWDYEMSEKSDWRLDCSCGSRNCRGIIGTYENMLEAVREKYNGYISGWLR